jgi:hypothetical protein
LVIPISDAGKLPPPFVKAVDRDLPDQVVCAWTGRNDDTPGEPTLRRALHVDERRALEQRRNDLRRALAPAPAASRDALLDEIAGMLGAYPSMQRHDAQAAAMMAMSYLWTVRDEPHWAIVKACTLIRGNRAGLNPSFPPTEPEFAHVVRREAAMHRLSLQRAEALLRAKADPVRAPRPNLEELKAKHGENWGITPPSRDDDDRARERRRKYTEAANRMAFERECLAAGVPTTSTVSPTLARLIREKMEGDG